MAAERGVLPFRVGAVLILMFALIWRRPDLLVIATPLAVVTVWSLLTRPSSTPIFDDRLEHSTIREGDATAWHGDFSGGGEIDIAVAALERHGGSNTRPSSGVVTAAATDGAASLDDRPALDPVGVRAPSRRCRSWRSSAWASIPLVDADRAPSPDDAAAACTVRLRLVRPARPMGWSGCIDRHVRVKATSSPASDRFVRATGCVGSTGPDRFASNELQVNSTWADLDIHVALLIDATDDFGVSEGIDGLASSLDGAVRAAGAIAEFYAPRGDRVSLRHVRIDQDPLGTTRDRAGPSSAESSRRSPA